MENRVRLEEALNTVASLDEIISPDYQPCVEAISGTLVYQVNLDTNFEDKNAYVTGVSKYIEEAARHAELVINH
jgi:cytoplasmic FMR1 interacting protein